MPAPTRDQFIEPILHFLAAHPECAIANEAYEAAALTLGLNDSQRQERQTLR